jgi:hypothetical protein
MVSSKVFASAPGGSYGCELGPTPTSYKYNHCREGRSFVCASLAPLQMKKRLADANSYPSPIESPEWIYRGGVRWWGLEVYVIVYARADLGAGEESVWPDFLSSALKAFSLASCCFFWGESNTVKRCTLRVETSSRYCSCRLRCLQHFAPSVWFDLIGAYVGRRSACRIPGVRSKVDRGFYDDSGRMARPCQDISRLERANVDVAYAMSLLPDAAPARVKARLVDVQSYFINLCMERNTSSPSTTSRKTSCFRSPRRSAVLRSLRTRGEPGSSPYGSDEGPRASRSDLQAVSRRSVRRLWAWAEPWYPGLAKLFLEQLRDNLITVYIYPHTNIRPMARIPLPLKDPTLGTFRPRVGRIVCSLVSLHGSV